MRTNFTLPNRLLEEAEDGTDPGLATSETTDVDWAALATEAETDDETPSDFSSEDGGPAPASATPEASPPSTPAPAVPPTPPAEQAPAPAAAQPPVVPATPAVPVVQPAQPAPTAQPTQAPASEPTADSTQLREAFRSQLEQRYALSEDDSDMFISDPGKVVPKLAANLHLGVTEAVTYGLMNVLPQLFDQFLAQREQNSKDEQEFFGKWPTLNTEQGRAQVKSIGQAWRAANPSAPKEEFIRSVGAMASIALQIPIPGITEAAPLPASNTPPPAPAAPGGAAPLPPKAASTNLFAQIAEEDLREG